MWQLRTFGGLSIETDGVAMVAPRRRPLALLALLAVAGERGLSREKVVALLWPESNEEHGRNSLSQALAALRRDTKADDPVLGSAELRLNPAVISSDVGEFERCIASGEEALERAVALYQGPFLDGFFVRDAANFERWTDEHRRRLHYMFAATLERLARAADERSDHEKAVSRWRQLAALEPTGPQAVSGLMRALAATGDRAAVRRQYRVHEELMRQEFDVAPDPAVTALADALLTDRTVLTTDAVAPSTDGPTLIASPAIGDGSPTSAPHEAPSERPGARRGARMLLIAATVAFATLTASLILRGRGVKGPPATIHLNLVVKPGYRLGGFSRAVAISPDGQTLVYGAAPPDSDTRLYSRPLDEQEALEIPGTVGAHDPFFSPDGQWIGFWTNKGLLKTPLRGGVPQPICQDPRCGQLQSYGARWGRDGRIVFARNSSGPQILRVSADGGLPETLAADSAGSLMYLFPEQLPSGRAVLVTAKQFGRTSVVAIPLGSGKTDTVIPSGSHARYLPTGHLLYVSDRQLKVVPFDPQRLKVLGPARVLADSINDDPRTLPYAVSESGVLAILRDFGSATKLVWKDRRGATTPIPLKPRDYVQPAVSPDGRRIAVTVREGPVRNVWVGSVTGEPLTQLTHGNDDIYSLWTRDSKRVVFTSGRTGHWNLYSTLADGGGEPERLTETPDAEKPTAWSPAGDVLLLNEVVEATKSLDIYEWSIKDKILRPFLSTRFNEYEAAFSPDGRWVAYQSDETGRLQVYVCAYRHEGTRQQVSIDGGRDPDWNENGRELFFQTETGAVMAVALSFDSHGLRSGKPIRLFTYASSGGVRNFQAMPDGRRFLVVEQGDAPPRIDVSLGLLDELQRNP